MNTAEIRRTAANWLYTSVGSFTLYVAFLAAYKISRPDRDIDFPLVGKLSYSATLILGTPVLTIATLSILYFCFEFLHNIEVRQPSYCHYFPVPFDKYLDSAFEKLRCLFFFLFAIFPTLISAVLFVRLFEQQQIYNTDNGTYLAKWSLFTFGTHWWDGDLWRWTSEQTGERLSGYPGFQPLLYTILIASCFILLVGLMIRIFIKH